MKLLSTFTLCVSLLFGGVTGVTVYAANSGENTEQNTVLDISVQSMQGRISAAITFSAPIKGDVDLDQWLDIETKAGEKVTGSWILDDKGKVLYFTNIEPDNSYVVSVEKGLPFANWGLLSASKQATLKIDPISPMLGFAGNGNLLASSLTDGLPVISVNVGNVDVDFYRVPQPLLVSFLSQNTRRGQQEFWEIESFIKKLDLVYTARFDLKLLPNQTATSYLPVKDITPLKQQGVYVAIMRKAGEYKYSHPATWFAISDIGVHMRLYKDQADVSVSSLATAKPKEGVELSLLNANGKVIAQQLSLADGTASFAQDKIEKSSLLIAMRDGDTSIVRLFGPELDLSEFPVSGVTNKAQHLFFYGQRDLYRPGEAVTVSALLRDSDGKLMPAQVVTFKLIQPDGRLASEQRLRPNVLGYYASQWQLPKDAATGGWSISAQIPGQADTRFGIQVEDFLPERMELLLESPEYLQVADAYKVSVTGKYLYGAPAADNTLQSELVSSLAAHPFKRFEKFYFSNPQITNYNRRFSLSDSKLNSKGELTITPDHFWKKAKTPLQLKMYTSLLDSGGRPVSRVANSFVIPNDKMVGIRPLFEDNTAPYDSNANFEIVLSDGKNKLATDNLQVKLIRERRNYHWLYTDSQGWTSDYTERHYTVMRKDIQIKAGELTSVSLPVDWGYYRLEVTNPQTNIVTGYKFRAGWDADETVMAGRPDRIGLALNQQHYKVGDTVEVQIKAPAAGRGYLLVESDKALYRQLVEIPEQGKTVSFKVQEGWSSHDLYVSVLLIQPGANREEKLPRRMMGIAPLRLDREARNLQVRIDTPDKILPDTQLIVPIQVLENKGEVPAKGPVQVTLAAVDVGILNISRFETPDPFKGFFEQRAYGVSARDSYSDLINAEKGVIAQLKFGGDSDVAQGGEADPDVQIVSLFSGVVDVNANGEATVTLSIPNFNGRLRLMAVAFAEQSYGASEKDIEVAAPVVAQLTKPRLMRAGDESQLALDLNNLSGSAQQLALNLSLGKGLRFITGDEQSKAEESQKLTVTLAKGEKKTLYFPIVASADYRSVEIDLTLNNVVLEGSQQILALNRHWQLSISPAWAKTDRQWQKVLSSGQSFNLAASELEAMLNSSLSGSLNVSNQPPLDIANHLSALKAYPYGCLEQTTSGVFPQLYINDQLLAQLGIKGSTAQARRAAVNKAIQRLQTMQRSSGGFGLWSSQSPEEHWLSVYVVDFLLRAKEAGYQVPGANLKKALRTLATYLRSPNKISSYYEDINSQTKFAVRAYAAQVLARINQAPLSILRTMYDRKRDNATPMALLQLGLALQQAGDKKRAEQALHTASLRVDDYGKDDIYYSSVVRDLALSNFWLLEKNAATQTWQPLLIALVQALESRRWLSTQERNALFLLAKELKSLKGSTLNLAWELAGEKVEQTLQRLEVTLSNSELSQAIQVRNNSEQNAYLNLRASGYTQYAPKALNNKLQVERTYYDLDGNRFIADKIRSGEKLIVELAVKSEQRLRHAMLVDLLPAGLEIENQNLADSYDQTDLKVQGNSISDIMYDLSIAHQEYRDDRFVMAIDLPRKRLVRVYYLVRAVSPGTYNVPPTFAEDMYRPEIRHQGASAGKITVLAR